jgi:hypothetical protein
MDDLRECVSRLVADLDRVEVVMSMEDEFAIAMQTTRRGLAKIGHRLRVNGFS